MQNLINSTGAINEFILKLLTPKIIKAIQIYHIKTNSAYSCLCPNNIVIDKKFNVKLTIGFKHLFYKNKENIVNKKFNYFDIKMRKKLIEEFSKENQILKVMKRLDYFDLGYMLIHCLLGDFYILDFVNYICKHGNNDCCCYLHCIIKSQNESKSKIKLENLINEQLYTKNLIDFICLCTSYKFDKSFALNLIKKHKWLIEDSHDNNKVNISLHELLKLSKDYNFKNEYLILNNIHNNSTRRLEKLIENISVILPYTQEYYNQNNIRNFDQILNSQCDIEELSFELGVDKDTLISKLKIIYDNIFNK